MPEPISSVAGAKAILSPTFIAGVLGAAISLRFTKDLGAWERATAVISGAIIAQYATPIAIMGLSLEGFDQAVGFFIGLFGLSLTAAIYEIIKKADPWGLIMSRYGDKPSDGGQ